MNRSPGALRRRLAVVGPRLVLTPFQAGATAVSVPIGIAALVLGSSVSAAMVKVLGNHVDIVRLWGALMVAGGIASVYGRYGHRPWLERAGLRMLGPSYALYGLAIVLGLGVGGLVAGPMFLVLSLSCFVRVRLSLREEGARDAAEGLINGPGP